MSHLMKCRNKKNFGITRNGLKWNLMEPPKLSLEFLVKDIKYLYRTKFKKLGFKDLISFIILRILQNIAYRIGYGNKSVRISIPHICPPDLHIMEKNLSVFPEPEQRKKWLFEFLAVLNNPDKYSRAHMPKSVIFELSNTCNYNCHGCGIGGKGIDNNRFMQLENLKKWSENLCSSVDFIRINGLGEATLHPNFKECVKILDIYPGAREIITNLSADLGIYRMLLERNYVLLISWDACSPKMMHELRKGSDFESMVKKLKIISKIAYNLNSPNPVLLFTLRKQNLNELEGTIEFAAKCGIKALTVNIFKYNDNREWTTNIRNKLIEVFFACEKKASINGIKLSLPSHLDEYPLGLSTSCKKTKIKCAMTETEVVIKYNGDLTPCNMMNPYLYGNIEERGFERSWNGVEAKVFRYFSGTENQHPFCKNCYYVDVNNRMNNYFIENGVCYENS